MLEKLFNNDAVKKLALSSLTKTMKENGISLGTFILDEQGEIDVQFHKNQMAVISAADLDLYRSAWLKTASLDEKIYQLEKELENFKKEIEL